MKRRLLILGVFLLLGAVVNVGVAWGLAAWVDPYVVNYATHDYAGPEHGPGWKDWYVESASCAGTKRVMAWWCDLNYWVLPYDAVMPRQPTSPRRLVLSWAGFLVPTTCPVGGHAHLAVAEARGWPMLTLYCGLESQQSNPSANMFNAANAPTRRVIRGVELAPRLNASVWQGRQWRALPLAPIWPGFIFNTIFYTFLSWLLFSAWVLRPSLRRRLRIRRGQCPACAYPVGTSPVCTECGKAVDRSRIMPS